VLTLLAETKIKAADPTAQALFKQEQLEPVLAQAKTGQRKVFFVDAVHFVLAPFLGFLWCFTRVFIRLAAAGRQRFNVLGANVFDTWNVGVLTITLDMYSACSRLGRGTRPNTFR